MEKQELLDTFNEVLSARSRINNDIHTEHHDFIQILIEREERKKERWEKVKTQVLGWGIIGMIGAMGSAVYHHFFKNGG
jgi:hypothetical protein